MKCPKCNSKMTKAICCKPYCKQKYSIEKMNNEQFDYCLECGYMDHDCDEEFPEFKCPECNSKNMYQAECSNSKCDGYGSLFNYCRDCGYSDDPCEL
jgi:hypothetical protein